MIVKIKQNCTTAQNELLAAVVKGNFRDSHREKMTKKGGKMVAQQQLTFPKFETMKLDLFTYLSPYH
jgi:hypothetical protein